MRRRAFIAVIGGAVAGLPRSLRAQQPDRVRTLGILMPYPDGDPEVRARLAAFQDELRRLGWAVGINLRLEERWATDDLDRVRAASAELVRLDPDVIFFTGGRVTRIIQGETRDIPTVFVGVSDPLGQGLVANLARPGGNLTGIANPEYTITAKLVEILKEMAPGIARIGLVLNPANPSASFNRRQFEAAAPNLGVEPHFIPVQQPADIETTFAAFARDQHGGLVFPSDLTILAHRALVTALAARHRLPAVYSDRAMAVAGGLASYSADRQEMFRQGAAYVNRILRGEKPGDLPVQQPTRYELVINTQAAKALGIALPDMLLARADEVIE
jgi:putative tryptophan/tyrosine transport system substrate-binding protein